MSAHVEQWYWVSTERMTCAIGTCCDIVVEAPPILRRFVGQHVANLGRWLRRQPGFRAERLP